MGRGEGRGIVEEEEFFKKYRDTRHLKMLKQEMWFFYKNINCKKGTNTYLPKIVFFAG